MVAAGSHELCRLVMGGNPIASFYSHYLVVASFVPHVKSVISFSSDCVASVSCCRRCCSSRLRLMSARSRSWSLGRVETDETDDEADEDEIEDVVDTGDALRWRRTDRSSVFCSALPLRQRLALGRQDYGIRVYKHTSV